MRKLASVAFLLASLPVLAIVPASKKQQLCTSTYVVAGKVLSAEKSRTKCAGVGVYGVHCQPGKVPGFANLSIEIGEVLGTKNIVSKFPRDAGIANGKVVDVYIYSPTFEDPAITSEHIASKFLQKQLTMGIAVQFGDVLKDGVRVNDYLGFPPYFARIWPGEEREWIAKVLSASDGDACPK